MGKDTKLYALTKEERDILREMVKEYRGRRHNTPTRAQTADSSQAPEVYIAKVPSAGIPALKKGTTGTGTHTHDQPGSAMCSLWNVNAQAYLQNTSNPLVLAAMLAASQPIKRLVLNLGQKTIPTGYILVCRDKWGQWIASTVGTNLRYLAQLTHDLTITPTGTGSSGSVHVNNLQPFDGSTPTDPTVTGTAAITSINAQNKFNLAGLTSDYCIIEYHTSLNQWLITQIGHHEINPMTGIQVSDPNFQTKSRSISAMVNHPETAYANTIIGKDCV